MSMISEQVKEFRDIAKYWKYNAPKKPVPQILNEAADIIEDLSQKLKAANMEQSEMYHNSDWVLCKDRLPKFGKRYLVSAIWRDGDFEKYSVYDAVYGSDGNWHCENYELTPYEVVAWMPLPEPATNKYARMTNAGRIRNMTEEELADFIYSFEFRGGKCQFPDRYKEKKNKSGGCLEDCKTCLLEWLKREVEE